MSDLPLARAGVDRAAHRRSDDEWLQAAWDNAASKVIVVEGGRAVVQGDRLVWTSPESAPFGERFFLGIDDAQPPGAGLFAVASPLPEPLPQGARPATLRDVGGALCDTEAGLLAHAAALERWHALHRCCPRCGAPTVVSMGGHVRRCLADGSEHHPRTDPAVIMLVTDADDRALLGHQASWPQGRMSTLAGYVEAGETLEHAVTREVAEEVGVPVGDVRYVGSQPWPFPSSLMVAFTARATSTDIVVDGVEISEARWFTRDELAADVETGTVRLPMTSSVAFYLIDTWFGGGLTALAPGQDSFSARR
jgi:NAD+ diphosphatase